MVMMVIMFALWTMLMMRMVAIGMVMIIGLQKMWVDIKLIV